MLVPDREGLGREGRVGGMSTVIVGLSSVVGSRRVAYLDAVAAAVASGAWSQIPRIPELVDAERVCHACRGTCFEQVGGALRECECLGGWTHPGFDFPRTARRPSGSGYLWREVVGVNEKRIYRPCSRCDIDPVDGSVDLAIASPPWEPDCASCRDLGWELIKVDRSRNWAGQEAYAA